jgi:hydrogenase maturation protease
MGLLSQLTYRVLGNFPGGLVILTNTQQKTLVLGIGNVIMGDEGVGVHAVRDLEKLSLPQSVECLDGGTGGFILLEPLQQAGRIFLIDAAMDGNAIGTVTRTTPRFSKDYPPTMTAHDIGMKDLLDAFYIQGGNREVILYTITIDPRQPIAMDLSEGIERAKNEAVERIRLELAA